MLTTKYTISINMLHIIFGPLSTPLHLDWHIENSVTFWPNSCFIKPEILLFILATAIKRAVLGFGTAHSYYNATLMLDRKTQFLKRVHHTMLLTMFLVIIFKTTMDSFSSYKHHSLHKLYCKQHFHLVTYV